MAFGDWLLNTVTIIGPAADLDRFGALFLQPMPARRTALRAFRYLNLNRILPTPYDIDDRRGWRLEHWGTDRKPWNVRVRDQPDRWTLPLSFDSACGFPEPAFRCFASLFPRLAFDCFSLEFNDEYMHIGWFNTPADCDDFHEADVPAGCTVSGPLRDAMTELRLQATMVELRRVAQKAEARI